VFHPENLSQRSIRVLHLLNGEFFSGVEQVVATLVRHHRGVDPKVVCLFDGEMARRMLGVFPVEVLPMHSRFDIRIVRLLSRYVRHNGIALLHAHNIRAHLVAGIIGAVTGLPVVVTIHSPSARDTTRSWMNAFNNRVERSLVPWTTAWTTVSEKLGEVMQRSGVPSARLVVIRNAIDVERYSGGNGARLRALLGCGDQHLLIGTVALIRPRKGIEILLRAVSLAVAALPDIRCIIVGDSENSRYIRELLKLRDTLNLAGRVFFVPFSEDIPDVMAALDVFVLPSLFGEGLPMVILEAMAASKPVVATAIDGISEAVLDMVTGILIPPGKPESLARALIELAANPERRKAMGVAAHQHAMTHFSAARMATAFENLYQDILQSA
jgi:glycosyltransferase involved in cell wall biosynthesis